MADPIMPWKQGALLYAAFAIAEIMAHVKSLAGTGTVLCLAALVCTYVMRASASEPMQQNHLRWLIRTFWIGVLVILPLSWVVWSMMFWGFVVLGFTLFVSAGFIVPFLGWSLLWLLMLVTVTLWWLMRYWAGWTYLEQGREIPDVTTWGIPPRANPALI